MDMAERSGADLRRPLRSADCFSERAIFFAGSLKTPFCRSSASLVSMTRLDQYRPDVRLRFVGPRFPGRFVVMRETCSSARCADNASFTKWPALSQEPIVTRQD